MGYIIACIVAVIATEIVRHVKSQAPNWRWEIVWLICLVITGAIGTVSLAHALSGLMGTFYGTGTAICVVGSMLLLKLLIPPRKKKT